MKKAIIIFGLSIGLLSCKKEHIECTSSISGVWYLEDNSIKVTDMDSLVLVEFKNQIHSPKKEPIILEYTKYGTDTIFCKNETFYPDLFFILSCDSVKGFAVEYRNIPTQGIYKEMTK